LISPMSNKFPSKSFLAIALLVLIALAGVVTIVLYARVLFPAFRFIDRSGHTVFDDRAEGTFGDFFSDGLVLCCLNNGKSCYWNKKGKLAFPKYYLAGDNFSEGLANVKDKEKEGWGYINTSGDLQIQYQFDQAFPFSEGLAAVKLNNHWGFIDRTGNFVVKAIFDGAASFSQGLAPVKIGAKIGYIDKKGDVVIKPQYDFAESFFDDRAYTVSLANQGTSSEKQYDLDKKNYKYIDKSGNIVIDSSALGLRATTIWFFLDRTSKYCLSAKEDYTEQHNQFGIPIEAFRDGIACVSDGDKYGFIDKQGNISIPLKFDCLSPFSEGLAVFSNTFNTIPIKGKSNEHLVERIYGYIDKKGAIAISPGYLRADGFSEGLACIADSHGYAYIDKAGNKVIKLNNKEYNFKGAPFYEGLALVGSRYENF
jgi:WG containing repeat